MQGAFTVLLPVLTSLFSGTRSLCGRWSDVQGLAHNASAGVSLAATRSGYFAFFWVSCELMRRTVDLIIILYGWRPLLTQGTIACTSRLTQALLVGHESG
jgi:hypothetical protein